MIASLFNFFFSFQLLSALFESLLFIAHKLGIGSAPTLTTLGMSDMLGLMLWLPTLFFTWTHKKSPLGLVLFLLASSLWSHTSFWPLLTPPMPQRGLSECLILLGAQSLGLLYRRHKTGNPLGLYSPDSFDENGSFSWLRFCVSFPGGLLIIGLLSLGLNFGASLDRLFIESRGYVKMQRDGLYTRSEIFKKQDQEVYLIGMMHIAEKSFYEDLLATIPKDNALILSEGVSDEKNLLEGGFRYKGLADKLHLSDQGEVFQRNLMQSHRVMKADLDVSQLRPETIAFLQDMSRLYRGVTPLSDLPKFFDPKLGEIFRSDLITRRNQEVLHVLDREAPRHRILVIPWGALHNAEIADGLEQRGYQRQEVQYKKVLDFSRLFARR